LIRVTITTGAILLGKRADFFSGTTKKLAVSESTLCLETIFGLIGAT
jgi:hypothetical protein